MAINIYTEPTDTEDFFAYNDVYYDENGDIGDAADGVQMGAANWSAPSPYTGDCVARAPGATATAVPALPIGGLVILAGLAGLLGTRKLRKAAQI